MKDFEKLIKILRYGLELASQQLGDGYYDLVKKGLEQFNDLLCLTKNDISMILSDKELEKIIFYSLIILRKNYHNELDNEDDVEDYFLIRLLFMMFEYILKGIDNGNLEMATEKIDEILETIYEFRNAPIKMIVKLSEKISLKYAKHASCALHKKIKLTRYVETIMRCPNNDLLVKIKEMLMVSLDLSEAFLAKIDKEAREYYTLAEKAETAKRKMYEAIK